MTTIPKTEKLTSYLSDYRGYHLTRGNRLTHYFGIPLILVSTLGLLGRIGVWPWMTPGFVLFLLSCLFYTNLHLGYGLAFSCVNLAIYFLAGQLNNWLMFAMFVVGWILQGVGHYYYEKRSPAFTKNFFHLLFGPFWIFYKLVKGANG